MHKFTPYSAFVSASIFLTFISSANANNVAFTNSTNSRRNFTFDSRQEGFAQYAVDLHNWYRARFGAGPLVWSEDLYPGTEEWANSCYWGHSGNPEYGENIAARSPNGIDVGEGLAMWMAEASDYKYFDPTFSEDTGHFTQVVWNNTRAVACWISNQCNFLGRGTGYLVCRYDPPGNVEGEFAENVAEAQY